MGISFLNNLFTGENKCILSYSYNIASKPHKILSLHNQSLSSELVRLKDLSCIPKFSLLHSDAHHLCAPSPDLPSDPCQCPPWQSSPVQAPLISSILAFFLLHYSFFPIRPKQHWGVEGVGEYVFYLKLNLGTGTWHKLQQSMILSKVWGTLCD